MISRVFPLKVQLEFEDRQYELGETINLLVELNARSDVDVREGRIDLVCEERYLENYTVMVPAARPSRNMQAISVTSVSKMPARVPKQVTKEYRETFVHSSVEFITDTRLTSGTKDTYRLELEIDSEPPPHAKQATLNWRLVAWIDVARARDIRKRYKLQVKVA